MFVSLIRKKLLTNTLLVTLVSLGSGCVYVIVGSLGALGGYVVSPDTVEGLIDSYIQGTLETGGKIFDFSVSVRMFLIRRLSGHPDADDGKGGSHDIDDGLQRIGKHRRGAGQMIGVEFGGHQQDGDH